MRVKNQRERTPLLPSSHVFWQSAGREEQPSGSRGSLSAIPPPPQE